MLTYSLVLPQEGSQRKSSEAIAEEIAAKSPTRSRRQEAEGLAKKFTSSFKIIFPSKIPFYYFPDNNDCEFAKHFPGLQSVNYGCRIGESSRDITVVMKGYGPNAKYKDCIEATTYT